MHERLVIRFKKNIYNNFGNSLEHYSKNFELIEKGLNMYKIGTTMHLKMKLILTPVI